MDGTGTQKASSQMTKTGDVMGTATTEKREQPKEERKPQRGRIDDKLKIFSGSANPALADEICAFLGIPRAQANIVRFSDGECYVQLLENVRGADVFVVQPTSNPVDQHLLELLLMMDALKRASARRITPVIPYFGYARQDRKDKPRAPISAKLMADLLTTAGANRCLVVDLHAPQIQGFFNIPVDHLFASPVLVSYFRELNLPALTVVSPDAGGVERARFFAKKMDSALAIVDKRRVEMDVTEVMHVIGDVKNRNCVILDDIIDTAGTLVKTAKALVDAGANRVYACASHAVLSGPAVERIAESPLEQVVVTNTIPLVAAARTQPKIKVLTVAGLVARAIQSIHEETSVSRLFT
jgi:ribose-phosphate pyrophosphokinase